MTRGYSYLRYSSPKQALGDSERRQLEATAAYARELGIDLDETLIDRGTSAYHAAHRKGHWGTFVARIDNHEIERGSVLFVEALDRMSREKPRIALSGFLDIINAGVEVITTIDRQRFTQASIDANDGQIHTSVGMMRGAHQESLNKGRRVREAWASMRLRVSAICPKWLAPNADRSAFDILPERQATLERIFGLCTGGHGLDAIAFILNTDGTAPFGRGGWTDHYIRKIITSRQVRGEMTVGKYEGRVRKPTNEVIMRYPSAISEAVWQAANAALAGRRGTGGAHARKAVNLLAGIACCAVCGGRMRLITKGVKKASHSYLRCHAGKHGLCANRRYQNYGHLETFVLDWFASAAMVAIGDHSGQQTEMANRIAAAKHEATVLEQEYLTAARIARKNPGALAEKALAEIQSEHAAKLKEVADLERQHARDAREPRSNLHTAAMDLIRQMPNLTGEARAAIRTRLNSSLRALIHKIAIRQDGYVAIHLIGGDGPIDPLVQLGPPAHAGSSVIIKGWRWAGIDQLARRPAET